MTNIGVPVLNVAHLTVRFGGLVAIDDVSFQVGRRQIASLIGPNGAGKTTILNCLTGFCAPPIGRMELFSGAASPFLLERMASHRIARDARVIRTFRKPRLFCGMSVLQNLLVAQSSHLMSGSGLSPASLLGLPQYRRAARLAIDRARYWLDRFALAHVADRAAGTLPFAVQRRLDIARALCARPRLLCLDDPAAGLSPVEIAELARMLRSLRGEDDLSVLVAERDLAFAASISDYCVAIDQGVAIDEGMPDKVVANPSVIRAYIGSPAAADVVPSVAMAC